MLRAWIAALVAAALSIGCSAENPFMDSGSQPRDGGGGFDAADARNTADTGTNVTPDAIPIQDNGTTLNPDSACATQTSDTTRAPMNLLIVLDRSGSMNDNGKWDAARNGLRRLLDSLPDDARVGLTYFPARSSASSESGYTTPALAIATLGMAGTAGMPRAGTHRADIYASLAATTASGGTPMACAMLGSVTHYTSSFTMDGSRNLILITDGEPTDECSGSTCGLFDITCLMNATEMAKLRILATAAGASRRTPPVRTYVVGTPDATASFLSNLAVNGGTRQMAGCESTNTCHYSLGTASFDMDLNRALDDIRGRAATCEFRIMIDPMRADPALINVRWTSTTGGMARVVPRDTTHTNGWDYSTDMRSVLLFGPICDEVRTNTTGGRVEILYGCPTQVPG